MKEKIDYLYTAYASTVPRPLMQTISDLSAALHDFIKKYYEKHGYYSALYFNDSNLTSFLKIENCKKSTDPDEYGGKAPLSEFDRNLTSTKSIEKGKIRIYDTTRAQYGVLDKKWNAVSCTSLGEWTNDCLGIVPVIVTPANAMFF